MGGEAVIIPEGTSIGSLIVGRPLESHGSDELYAARQPALERDVEVQVLRSDLLQDVARAERFRREARLGSRVAHPNLLAVIDCFSLRGDHYLVREHVEGDDLASILLRKAPLPRPVAARIALEIARGLLELHAHGVVHTGLRPELVRISRWGEVKLGGLGEARDLLEQAGALPTEPSDYGAPELAHGGRADERSDVYSLGMLLAHLRMGTGRGGRRTLTLGIDRLARLMSSPDPAARPSLAAARRRLERAVGQPDPSRARIELAAWLWQSRALHAERALSPRGAVEPPVEEPRLQAAPRAPEVETRGTPSIIPDPDRDLCAELPPGSLRPPLELAEPQGTPDSAEQAPRGRQAGDSIAPPPRTRPIRALALAAALVGAAGPLAWWMAGRGAEAVPPAIAPTVEIPASMNEPVGAAPPAPVVEPAHVVFTAYPWAEIRIDEGDPFLTPRATPLDLRPGEHEVVFRHPRHGEYRQRFRVFPGEQRIIGHDFLSRMASG